MNSDGLEGFKAQPFMGKIFFVDKDQYDVIQHSSRMDYLTIFDTEIQTLPLSEGVYPVELNAESLSVVVVFESKNDSIIIRGSQYKNSLADSPPDKQIYGGIHIGHPVKKIIKG